MNTREILTGKFTEPAFVISINGDDVALLDANEKLLTELEVNISIDEFLKIPVSEMFDEENFASFIKSARKCSEKSEETSAELKLSQILNCCGCDFVYIRARFVLAEKAADTSLIYVGVRNITVEKSNLETLKESEKRFKIASEQINIYYWEYTIATREMRPCFRCMRDLGLPALVENYPEPLIEVGIIPADQADSYREWLDKHIDLGDTSLEPIVPLTVGRVPFRFKYTIDYKDGKPYKAFGSATLVSEDELEKSRISKSIIEALANSYDMISIVDYDENKITPIKGNDNAQIDDMNDFTTSMSTFMDNFETSDGESVGKFFDLEYLKTNLFVGTDKREIDFREKSTGRWLHVIHMVLERDGERVKKVLSSASIMDDEAAKRLEADRIIAKQKKELEIRQNQLEQAVEEANRANRAKSDFLARMSHEIRTPMNAIMGMNEIIVKSTTDSTVKGYADDAYNAALGLLGTINEILDFSKIESGKMELVEDDFDLAGFTGNLYTMFALRAEDKNLALIFDVDDSLPAKVHGDDTHLRQVLTNLLSNAVKYTEKGTIRFEMKEVSHSADEAVLKFSVSDTGRGIREEDIKKLFEAFERFDLKENKNIEGTGLGMNIVSGLLELMGSKLNISSEYGKGTTFSFTIKLAVADSTPMGDFRNKLNKKAAPSDDTLFVDSGKKVLVVDDNAINIKVIRALLRATKVSVDTASSGREALELTKENQYDLIFLDHYMPEMDGIETIGYIKSQSGGKNAETPVIALTANAIKGAEGQYLENGFVDTVFKPTTQKILSDVMKKYLG